MSRWYIITCIIIKFRAKDVPTNKAKKWYALYNLSAYRQHMLHWLLRKGTPTCYRGFADIFWAYRLNFMISRTHCCPTQVCPWALTQYSPMAAHSRQRSLNAHHYQSSHWGFYDKLPGNCRVSWPQLEYHGSNQSGWNIPFLKIFPCSAGGLSLLMLLYVLETQTTCI